MVALLAAATKASCQLDTITVVWSDSACLSMRQNVVVQQAVQALLQVGLVPVFEVGYPDQGLTEVSEENLAHWAVHLHRGHAHGLGKCMRQLVAQPLDLCCWPAGLHAGISNMQCHTMQCAS